jgi:undecaprenyl-diphosphatase
MRIIIAIFLFLLTLIAFVYIADEIVLEHETLFDQTFYSFIAPLHSAFMTKVMSVFTFFGSHLFLFPAYVILIAFLWFKHKKKLAFMVVSIGLTSTAVLFTLKALFQRARPLDPLIQNVAGFSFPSGHSFSSFTFYGILAYLLFQTNIAKQWKITAAILLFLFALIIAMSRVYLRVHYPSDIVAGYCLSVVWLLFSFWIFKKTRLIA